MSKQRDRRTAARAKAEKPQIGVLRTGKTRDDRLSKFHYTTASGLIGIVTSNTVWATHANFLNDTAECQLLSSLLTPQVETEYRKTIPRLMDVGAFKPEITQIFGTALNTESEKVTSAVLASIERVSPIYITSFCQHEKGTPECNHGLLSQWRGYAKGGFAIEFDEGHLDDLMNLENSNHSYQAIITRQVEYDNHEKAAGLRQFEGIAAAALKVAFESAAPNLARRPDVREILGARTLQSYIGAFIQVLPFLKSARFKEENEYRLVALPTRSKVDIAATRDERPQKEMHFREGAAGSIIPYIKLFESIKRPLPIKKLIVGPHQDQQNQYHAARLLLEKYGIDAPVVKSGTTIRF